MTSLAAVLTRPKEPLELLEREPPHPGPGEVTVRIEACALGLNDWHVAMLDALPVVPMLLGCEAVGRVEPTGKRVGITPLATSCLACPHCARGQPAHCASATWHGFSKNGALCTRGNFAQQHLVPLPDEADAAELAALMGSGWAALTAVRAANVARGEAVGLFGLGGVGHLVLQLLDGEQVVAFDPDPHRAALAQASAKSPPLDVAIVCVPSIQAIQRAQGLLQPNGRLIIAADSPSGRLDMSLHALTARGLTVTGTSLGPRALLDEVLARHREGKLKPLVHRLPLREAPAQLYALRDGGFVGRMVFIP